MVFIVCFILFHLVVSKSNPSIRSSPNQRDHQEIQETYQFTNDELVLGEILAAHLQFAHRFQMVSVASHVVKDMNMPLMAMSHCSAGWDPRQIEQQFPKKKWKSQIVRTSAMSELYYVVICHISIYIYTACIHFVVENGLHHLAYCGRHTFSPMDSNGVYPLPL